MCTLVMQRMPWQRLRETSAREKTLDIYIFLSAEFCTFRVDYLDIYIINLDSGDNLTVLYNLIYLYIYNVYRSWASCSWATYPEAILVKIYTLVYFSSKIIDLVIKSHDKYQSLILIGLARAEKASSGNRSVLVHYRSHWRGWRPLVTPWAYCIKEVIEPWKSQKRLFPSHAQVGVSLSLSLLFSCSVSASIIIIIIIVLIIIITMNMYLQRVHNNSGYGNKPRPDYSKTSPFANALSLSLLLSLSLSSVMAIVCVHGYLTHTM